ncbi:MAG: diaminopimelate decarboxylase [Deltaproteobacteria bacterium HGW-Deltaproteobacteria-14]|jgi:diaminopimelate decarboxylase|nr:MAG: diaminopimelate decarboxylase [Deltaproteobacteria bacterium HGW-Deltaproteobacteria-14]
MSRLPKDPVVTRLPYEPPTIIAHKNGLANKFGGQSARRSLPRIEGVPVAELVERFGSPLFVFSEHTLRRTYREVHRAFSLRYPKVQLAWSYKTNYLDAVCRVFHDEGAWAEVVSEVEYDMARRNGVPGSQILFNGPYKPEPALRVAIEEGAHIHIDHHDELYTVEKIAKELGRKLPVTLRINMDTGIQPRWDRFGFNFDNGEALTAIRRLHTGGHLVLEGLHAHIGTFMLDPQAYARGTAKLAELALAAKRDTGVAVKTIDLGGGLPSRATLHGQYGPGADSKPPVDDYAEAITGALLAAGFPQDELPTLLLESGRALVDEAGFMIASVVANKRLANGTRAVIVDAGVNVLFTSFWYRHDVLPAEDHGGMLEEAVVYGPLCMNIDVVRPSVLLPPLEAGDAVVFRPVGAYNVTQSMQFIRLRPAIVMIGENKQVDLIRRSEHLDDLKGPELLPERLRP